MRNRGSEVRHARVAGAFGERLTVVKIAGSAVAIAGVALVSTSRSDTTLTSAVWIVIAAAVVQGIYHPLTKMLLRRYSGLEVATYGMVVGVLLTAPFVGFAWTVPVATSTSLLDLVPAAAIVIAYVWLGEKPIPAELIGGLVVIAGVRTHTLGDAAQPAAT